MGFLISKHLGSIYSCGQVQSDHDPVIENALIPQVKGPKVCLTSGKWFYNTTFTSAHPTSIKMAVVEFLWILFVTQ